MTDQQVWLKQIVQRIADCSIQTVPILRGRQITVNYDANIQIS
jgi:hypothetical protein